MIDKIVCFFKGHRRGKRVGITATSTKGPIAEFQCPRCKATWTRREKAAA